MHDPIDAVITWVDGQDPKHIEKLNQHLLRMGIPRPIQAAPTRYNQSGELDYCVRSILHFAPWIRTLFILTDNQYPQILEKLKGTAFADKVQLIFHQDVFHGFETVLPTFNSMTIETMLWRIPGLANQFIYFNDDCILVRYLKKSDFFRDTQVVIRGHWKRQLRAKWRYRLMACWSLGQEKIKQKRAANEHRSFQENTAVLTGFSQDFFHLPHVPFAIKKNIFAAYFSENPQLLQDNIAYSFRDLRQFWPISWFTHWIIKHQEAIIDNTRAAMMVNGACHPWDKIEQRLKKIEKNPKYAFLCIQSMDEASNQVQNKLIDWLERQIPG